MTLAEAQVADSLDAVVKRDKAIADSVVQRDERLAAVDGRADLKLECRVLFVQLADRLANRERGADRAFRIVFVRGRRTEQREQRIADELVDEAAKILHRRRQLLEQFVLQRLHDLRIKLLAHRGEAAEVGKQHRNGAAVGFGIDLVEFWPRGLFGPGDRIRRQRRRVVHRRQGRG